IHEAVHRSENDRGGANIANRHSPGRDGGGTCVDYHYRAGSSAKAVGKNDMPGLWFEEFSVGQIFEHAITRTVTEMDNMLFSNMTLNPQPLHIDFHFAAETEFGKPLVNSLFTLGLMLGIS